ncbi:MAG: VCBS repeat-containing protein [Pirellulales bacterium]
MGKGRVLKNIGTRSKPVFSSPKPIEVQWPGETPAKWVWWNPQGKSLVTQWRTTPVLFDFTGDGLLDLAMLDQEGYFVLFKRAKVNEQLVLLPPEKVFASEDGMPLRFTDRTAGGSGRRKIAVVDWDGDGQLDILLNSSNADLYRGLGLRDGKWIFKHEGSLAKQNIEGHDVSPTTVDFDGNGVRDFLGGAEDGRQYFLANPRSK